MKRLWAPMEFAVWIVSEWMWQPLVDKLTGFEARLEEARRRNHW